MLPIHSKRGKKRHTHAIAGFAQRCAIRIGARRVCGCMLIVLIGLLAGCGSGSSSGDYFPFEAGRSWLYSGTLTTMDGAFGRLYPVQAGAPETFIGETVYPQTILAGRRYLYAQREDGIWRVARQWGARKELVPYLKPELVLPDEDAPQSWQSQTITQVLEVTGPPQETLFKVRETVPMTYTLAERDARIQTEAGNFSGCIRVEGRGRIHTDVGNYIGKVRIEVESNAWYAPDVGLVRIERTERTSSKAIEYGHLALELVSFSR